MGCEGAKAADVKERFATKVANVKGRFVARCLRFGARGVDAKVLGYEGESRNKCVDAKVPG